MFPNPIANQQGKDHSIIFIIHLAIDNLIISVPWKLWAFVFALLHDVTNDSSQSGIQDFVTATELTGFYQYQGRQSNGWLEYLKSAL